MTTFALLPGAWHGAWCFDRLERELEQRGHSCIAVDLPCDDAEAGWADYAAVTLSALDGVGDDLVVVGHSLGGGVVPLVAAVRPVRRMVFLCSFPPSPGQSLDDDTGGEPALSDPRALAWRSCLDDQGRYVWPDFESADYAMYHDCSREAARAAFERLRPQGRKPFEERWPLNAWPEAPVSFIVCSDDRLGTPGALRSLARTRFGIEAIEIGGSHSPFLSRPADVAEALVTLDQS